MVTTETETDVCTYTLNNEAVALSYPPDNSVVSGSIVGSQLTLTDLGLVLIFQKVVR